MKKFLLSFLLVGLSVSSLEASNIYSLGGQLAWNSGFWCRVFLTGLVTAGRAHVTDCYAGSILKTNDANLLTYYNKKLGELDNYAKLVAITKKYDAVQAADKRYGPKNPQDQELVKALNDKYRFFAIPFSFKKESYSESSLPIDIGSGLACLIIEQGITQLSPIKALSALQYASLKSLNRPVYWAAVLGTTLLAQYFLNKNFYAPSSLDNVDGEQQITGQGFLMKNSGLWRTYHKVANSFTGDQKKALLRNFVCGMVFSSILIPCNMWAQVNVGSSFFSKNRLAWSVGTMIAPRVAREGYEFITWGGPALKNASCNLYAAVTKKDTWLNGWQSIRTTAGSHSLDMLVLAATAAGGYGLHYYKYGAR